ncbi:type II secretion system F family protein [Noviherbaspirillum sp. CPCC 100848]|uniref:Type II secretion system F family protein n=1 Tax=Noviherbaspirillum album TaxID=3080276 RepID=A0ABU6JI17_9BURK|nr:type II secretion system F family protein [Noviherbaspirillum sp. CPCC 100848]MEC4723322.1 type II secretion system F family protein [Noviherbaspirillum sp. CPCC 100848]
MILPALIFISVTLGLAGLILLATPSKAQQRLQALSDPAAKSNWIKTAVSIAGPFAKLSAPSEDWDRSRLRISFVNAGIRNSDAHLIYFGVKTLLPLLFAAATFFVLRASSQFGGMTFIMWVMLAALLGCYLPNLYLFLRIRRRKREIFENFPDAADLMLVCVEAGFGLDAGLTKVAEEMKIKSPALAEELQLANLEMRAGGTREKSLRNLAQRTGIEEISTFATMLTQADKFGTSIGESLRVFSDDLRHKRQTRAEEAAAKIPTKLLFPLVVCIFPSIIMVIMGPAAIQVIRTILPMIGKGSV